MKRRVLKMLGAACLLLAMTFAVGAVQSEQVFAKVNYTKKTIDKTEQFGKVKAVVKYELIQLKGSSPEIKKINKALKKDYKKFMKSDSVEDLKESAKQASDHVSEKTSFYYQSSASVMYNKKGIVSVMVSVYWYAGGVSNTVRYGLNYNVKTGKKLKVNEACGKSIKKIKEKLCKSIKKEFDSDDTAYAEAVKNIKAKKSGQFDFYIKKKGTVMVTFEPYELGYGGWFREYKVGKR